MTDKIHKKTKKELTTAAKMTAMIEALRTNLMVVSAASDACNVSRESHYKWLRTNKKYKERVETTQMVMTSYVETKLLEKIRAGDFRAIRFYLETKGKDQGYDKRTQVKVSGKIEQKGYVGWSPDQWDKIEKGAKKK